MPPASRPLAALWDRPSANMVLFSPRGRAPGQAGILGIAPERPGGEGLTAAGPRAPGIPSARPREPCAAPPHSSHDPCPPPHVCTSSAWNPDAVGFQTAPPPHPGPRIGGSRLLPGRRAIVRACISPVVPAQPGGDLSRATEPFPARGPTGPQRGVPASWGGGCVGVRVRVGHTDTRPRHRAALRPCVILQPFIVLQ